MVSRKTFCSATECVNHHTIIVPKTAIFYHCVFAGGNPVSMLPSASEIITEQMQALESSGLLSSCDEFYVGINGGGESTAISELVFPPKAIKKFHGTQCKNELRTILMLEEWVKTHSGWNVLYFHSKGATTIPGSHKSANSNEWRATMMRDLVEGWRQCVTELDAGYDIVCSTWKWNMCDGTQHIPSGNFLWIKSDFAAKLPSIYLRARIKQDGIDALFSRWEAEVYWGNGVRPNVKQFRPNGGNGIQ